MQGQDIDVGRGFRLRQAIELRGHRKMLALAAELNISSAALSKWIQGHAMSLENACRIASLLDISLDWLILGRNGPDWLRPDQLSGAELNLIDSLRRRPRHIAGLMSAILAEIPSAPET